MFKWLCHVWHVLSWVVNFLYSYVKPIYPEIVTAIKAVKALGLKDSEARAEVFKRIAIILKDKGISDNSYSDCIINAIIEIVYIYIKKRGE